MDAKLTFSKEESMSRRIRILPWLLAIFCSGSLVHAQGLAQNLAPVFTISGTSTVRAWSCPAQGVTKVTPGTSSPAVPGFPHGVQAVVVRVPVKAIACEEPLMIEHLREALKEKTHPDIVYEMTQYTLNGADTAQTTGTLTITGVTKPINLTLKLSPAPNGLRGVGETTIDLTQFSVTPPVIFEGLLKVGKDVRIRFDAVLPSSQKAGGFHD
jgi:YceI-like protein